MANIDLIPHLFRKEYSKITAVLSKLFGIEHIEVAEDIASEAFLSAMETWPYKGIPENPTAWLYTVAKNKAKNYFKRSKIFKEKIADHLKNSGLPFEEIEIDLSARNITDSQLQMLFAVCHPSISEESQISLALRLLCGFGIDEIAVAFLTNKETVNKRLFRAKERLKSENIRIELPNNEQVNARLETVLRALYLLFSEGYYSESKDTMVRTDLCLEAMKLTYLLLDNQITNQHSTNSLMALMCFHSSRLEARQSENGEMILYQDQDQSLWNKGLIEKGFYYLQQASKWGVSSKYYLEASIAYWHTVKADTAEKWENILNIYNLLLTMEYSPIAALNRTYVLSKVKGNKMAIAEAEKLNLTDNHFYFVLLGELHKDLDKNKAKDYLVKALALCKTETEKRHLQKQIDDF